MDVLITWICSKEETIDGSEIIIGDHGHEPINLILNKIHMYTNQNIQLFTLHQNKPYTKTTIYKDV